MAGSTSTDTDHTVTHTCPHLTCPAATTHPCRISSDVLWGIKLTHEAFCAWFTTVEGGKWWNNEVKLQSDISWIHQERTSLSSSSFYDRKQRLWLHIWGFSCLLLLVMKIRLRVSQTDLETINTSRGINTGLSPIMSCFLQHLSQFW